MNSNFYIKKKEITINEIFSFLKIKSSNLIKDEIITNINTLDRCEENDVTFLQINRISGNKYINILKNKKVKYCLVDEKNLHNIPSGISPIIVQNPYVSFLELYDFFYEPKKQSKFIDTSVVIDNSVFCANDVIIKKNTTILSNSYIGSNVQIGEGCIIESNVSLSNCIIGNNVRIGSGARIGQDGFGFLNEKIHNSDAIYKIKHFGGVEIGSDVSIGCNTCIDRGLMSNTKIGNFCKIDNLVQIAHNVEIGDKVLIAGCASIAGSTKIGNGVIVGGRASITGHITIGDKSIICGQTAVSKSFKAGSIILSGWPGEDYKSWIGKVIVFNKIIKTIKSFALSIRKIKIKLLKLKKKLLFIK